MTSALKSTEVLMDLSFDFNASQDKKIERETERGKGDNSRGSFVPGSR